MGNAKSWNHIVWNNIKGWMHSSQINVAFFQQQLKTYMQRRPSSKWELVFFLLNFANATLVRIE